MMMTTTATMIGRVNLAMEIGASLNLGSKEIQMMRIIRKPWN
jgi:hypothetical protein